MFELSVKNLKMIFSAALILPCIIGCQNGFKDLDIQSGDSAGNWTQGRVIESASDAASSSYQEDYCALTVPDQFRRDEELRATASSQNIVRLQVSVNDGEFGDLPTVNGTMIWPGNSFEVATYHLRFRALKANGSVVACSPSSKMVTITPAQGPAPGGAAPVNIDRNYLPLTGYSANGSATDNGFKNFKTIYHPDNLKNRMVYKLAPGVECHVIHTDHNATTLRMAPASQKYRIFLPPGTMSVDIMTYTYWDTTTRQAMAVRMDAAPVSSYEETLSQPIIPEGDRVLERLVNGEEFRSYVGESGNLLPRFGGGTNYNGATPYVYRSPRGGWLYMNQVKLIGDVAMRIETRTCVDPEIYRAWYNSAQWDADGNPL
ncbi:MAG: hypothetical protein HUU57_05855 [Bdellovibrio sp.]|nr:hypothetical protein [Bdellovibrio sp.]